MGFAIMAAAPGALLRGLVIALGVAELLFVAWFVALMLQGSDQIGKSIGQGMAQLAMIPTLACVVPGLLLGLTNRRLGLALALLLVALPLAYVLWRMA